MLTIKFTSWRYSLKIYNGCYKLFRQIIAQLADNCLLLNGSNTLGNLHFICKPIILEDCIRFLIQVPPDFKLTVITNVKIKAKTELLFLIDIAKDVLLTRDFGYVLNIKVKLGSN